MNLKKFEAAGILVIIGWLITAFVHGVQVESRVDFHDSTIKILSDKMDKISSDVSFIRGIIEKNKE